MVGVLNIKEYDVVRVLDVRNGFFRVWFLNLVVAIVVFGSWRVDVWYVE